MPRRSPPSVAGALGDRRSATSAGTGRWFRRSISPTLYVSAQNDFYTPLMAGEVCTISGSYLRDLGTAAVSNTWAEYQAITQADVETSLRDNFLPDTTTVTADTRGTLILDMEGTADDDATKKSHPNDLHTLSDADKAIIITCWKLRIAAVRAVFPNARIAQYGLPIPQTRGDPTNQTWIDRIAALVQAGTATGYAGVGSAYDELDAIAPVLYARYGPTDSALNWNSYDDQADTCITGAKTIKKSNGSLLTILPLINTYIANGNSDQNDMLLLNLPTADPLGSTWGQQFPVFRDHGIREVICWNGANSPYARQGLGSGGEDSTHLLSEFIYANKGWLRATSRRSDAA